MGGVLQGRTLGQNSWVGDFGGSDEEEGDGCAEGGGGVGF